ncbi:hypothetical protein [Natronococcus jeotgali]|uniref:Uncharacterized protein n=1 Tax=Natronococcus jeotgali DSM 18795 TaxID=1227498 RepID=L9X3D3_9EURY|nr:hypothetical protein [Natronococcus jeotgali]ELY55078.1 hypothetical protein C492_16041 [Natronococcus jeotgali DSM 18795]
MDEPPRNEEVERAAAICEGCGDAIAVRVEADGQLRPIGSGTGECCACDEPDLRVMDDAAEILDDPGTVDRSA